MDTIDYKSPDPKLPRNWKRTYLIGASTIGGLHFAGSLAFVCAAHVNPFWLMDPPPIFFRLFYAYQFPLDLIPGPLGQPLMMYAPVGEFLLLALVNAMVWGLGIISIWYAASRLQNRGGQGRD